MQALRRIFAGLGLLIAVAVIVCALLAGYLFIVDGSQLFGKISYVSSSTTVEYESYESVIDGGLNDSNRNVYLVVDGYDVNIVFTSVGSEIGSAVLNEKVSGFTLNGVTKASLSSKAIFQPEVVEWNKYQLSEASGLVTKGDSKITLYLNGRDNVDYHLWIEGGADCNITITKEESATYANIDELIVENSTGTVNVSSDINVKEMAANSENGDVIINTPVTNLEINSSGYAQYNLNAAVENLTIGQEKNYAKNIELTANEVVGSITAYATNGLFTYKKDISGNAVINTSNGEFKFATVAGNLTFKASQNGSLTVAELKGELKDSSINFGDLTISKLSKSAEVTSVADGKIKLTYSDVVVDGNLVVKFENGDVTINNIAHNFNITALSTDARGNVVVNAIAALEMAAPITTPNTIKTGSRAAKLNIDYSTMGVYVKGVNNQCYLNEKEVKSDNFVEYRADGATISNINILLQTNIR